MNHTLFIVCPFSFMETFLRTRFGNDIFVLTTMTAESQFHEIEYIEVIKDTIIRENITQIYIVNDTSCRFINGMLKGETDFGSSAEKNLQNIFIDNYSFIMGQPSFFEKVKTIAALNVKQQAMEIMENELFKLQFNQNNIIVKGLVTTRSENKINEIKLFRNEL